MSVNLLDLLKGQLGSEVMKQAGSFLGESESATSSAMDSILPSILGGLMNKASSKGGAESIFNMINEGNHDGGILDNLGSVFGGGDSSNSILSMGGPILNMIFGNRTSGIIDMISNVTGFGQGSAGSLLKMAAPIVMGMLGMQKKKMGLDMGGLAKLLMGQKDYIKDSLPSGFADTIGISGLDGITNSFNRSFDSTKEAAASTVNYAKDTASGAANVAADTAKAGGSLLGKLLPLLLIFLLLAFLFTYFKGCGDKVVDAGKNTVNKTTQTIGDGVKGAAGAVGDAASKTVDGVKGAANKTAGAVGSAAGALKDMMAFSLPSGESLNLKKGSFGEKFATFLGDKDGDLKSTFTFDNLRFDTGSANLTADSQDQLNNLRALLKAYPSVVVRIDGHTDNTGDAAANRVLSKKRADSVKAALVKAGIADKRVQTRGLGDKKPVASNDTDSGKAKNRRIELSILKK